MSILFFGCNLGERPSFRRFPSYKSVLEIVFFFFFPTFYSQGFSRLAAEYLFMILKEENNASLFLLLKATTWTITSHSLFTPSSLALPTIPLRPLNALANSSPGLSSSSVQPPPINYRLLGQTNTCAHVACIQLLQSLKIKSPSLTSCCVKDYTGTYYLQTCVWD